MSQIVEVSRVDLDDGLRTAELLHRADKLEDALALLRQLCEAYPDSPHPLTRATGLMLHLGHIAEAEPLVEAGRRRFPDVGSFYRHHAVAAERRRDWTAAAARWAEVRRLFPDAVEGYLGGGTACRELGQFAEAETLLQAGMKRLPDQMFLFADYAHLAERQHDWANAAQRWSDVRSRFPEAWRSHFGLAAALRRAGRVDDAEAVASSALMRWPEQIELLIEHAYAAEARKDWAESARRWDAVRTCDPGFWPAYVEGAVALSRAGHDDAAGALLTQAVERFPNEATPAIRLARWHDGRNEWQASLPIWQVLQRTAPAQLESHLGAAMALRMAGRLEAAQDALDEAARRFPGDHDVIREKVLLAYARELWADAAAACAEGARLFPDDVWFPRFRFEVDVRLMDAVAAEDGIPKLETTGKTGSVTDSDRLMEFESLGGTGHGCEFGLYQRSYGIEPLGLLRWNDLHHNQLIDALESEFAGVGTPEQTSIFIPATKNRPQYWSRDERFYMVSSTHVFVDEVPQEKLFPKLCRRLQFLRRKLIDDLRAGEKLFVYKNMFRNLTEDELDRLYRAMRRYGDNTLLYLCYADADHPDGTVEWQRPGLILGYVARFTHAPDDTFLGPPNELFDRVTRTAYQLWKAGEAPSVGPSQSPENPGPAIEHAWEAHRRSDWPEAVSRWQSVRARFPTEIIGYLAAATALRELRRNGEAEALLLDAAQRFPNDPAPAIDAAWMKTHRRAGQEAALLWAELRERFPDHLACYVGGALAARELRQYDEAEALLAAAVQRAPDDIGVLTERAWLAQIRRDWPEAIRRWDSVRERNPAAIAADIQAARALCELWRHDEAEVLLSAAIARRPDEPELAAQYAWIAHQQRRQQDAADRYAYLRKHFPGREEGWLGGGQVLRDQFRLTEAGEMLLEGFRHCPNNPRLLLDYAQLPTAPISGEDKDWPETLRRMERLRADFPAFELGYTFGIRLLRSANHTDAAEELAGQASARFPENSEFGVEYARAAEERSDWPEAIRRYGRLREQFPRDPAGDVGLARALAASGQFNEAEAALIAAMERFPGYSAPFAAYAQIAVDRQDWPAALLRWTQAQSRFPDQKEFAHRIHDAQNRVAEMEPTRELADHERAALTIKQAAKPDPSTVDQQVSELVTHFESLGGRGLGCEFGIFQRDCGAEPLGLLRWADMTYEKVVEALESRFEGVGTPEFTDLFTSAIGGGRGEYCTVDKRGMMFMRAFIYEDEMPFDKMYTAACRRLQFLARKLISDLEQGSKIFVFRVTERNLTSDEIDVLHAAMQRYGDNVLLYVRYQDDAHPNGTVEMVKPGLMIGYMDRFKVSPTREISSSPPTASWLAVCRAAYALWVGASA